MASSPRTTSRFFSSAEQLHCRHPNGIGAVPGPLCEDAHLRHVLAALRTAAHPDGLGLRGAVHPVEYQNMGEGLDTGHSVGERLVQDNFGDNVAPAFVEQAP